MCYHLSMIKMRFSEQEVNELLKAWLAISFAFAIALGGGIGKGLLATFVLAAFTVGLAFLLHELAHKFMAQRFGCWAEFRSFDLGLLLAVLMSFTGFIFAAPGAVVIAGIVTPREGGQIAAAGPLVNLVLAVAFLVLGLVFGSTALGLFFHYGRQINAWLALFNLMPFWQLDGLKVLNWNRQVWLGLIVSAVVLVFVA